MNTYLDDKTKTYMNKKFNIVLGNDNYNNNGIGDAYQNNKNNPFTNNIIKHEKIEEKQQALQILLEQTSFYQLYINLYVDFFNMTLHSNLNNNLKNNTFSEHIQKIIRPNNKFILFDLLKSLLEFTRNSFKQLFKRIQFNEKQYKQKREQFNLQKEQNKNKQDGNQDQQSQTEQIKTQTSIVERRIHTQPEIFHQNYHLFQQETLSDQQQQPSNHTYSYSTSSKNNVNNLHLNTEFTSLINQENIKTQNLKNYEFKNYENKHKFISRSMKNFSLSGELEIIEQKSINQLDKNVKQMYSNKLARVHTQHFRIQQNPNPNFNTLNNQNNCFTQSFTNPYLSHISFIHQQIALQIYTSNLSFCSDINLPKLEQRSNNIYIQLLRLNTHNNDIISRYYETNLGKKGKYIHYHQNRGLYSQNQIKQRKLLLNQQLTLYEQSQKNTINTKKYLEQHKLKYLEYLQRKQQFRQIEKYSKNNMKGLINTKVVSDWFPLKLAFNGTIVEPLGIYIEQGFNSNNNNTQTAEILVYHWKKYKKDYRLTQFFRQNVKNHYDNLLFLNNNKINRCTIPSIQLGQNHYKNQKNKKFNKFLFLDHSRKKTNEFLFNSNNKITSKKQSIFPLLKGIQENYIKNTSKDTNNNLEHFRRPINNSNTVNSIRASSILGNKTFQRLDISRQTNRKNSKNNERIQNQIICSIKNRLIQKMENQQFQCLQEKFQLGLKQCQKESDFNFKHRLKQSIKQKGKSNQKQRTFINLNIEQAAHKFINLSINKDNFNIGNMVKYNKKNIIAMSKIDTILQSIK